MVSEPVPSTSEPGEDVPVRVRAGGAAPEFFRSWFEHFPDPVIAADARGAVIFLNKSAQLLTGRSAAEPGGLLCSDILRIDPTEPHWSLMRHVLDHGALRAAKAHVGTRTGKWLPVSLSAQLAIDEAGNPAGLVVVAGNAPTSIAGQVDRLENPIFSSVINNFPMPFFTVDTDLTVTYMNHHLEKLTGYQCSEVVNRMTCAELLRAAECGTADCVIKRVMENRTPIAGLRQVIVDREGRRIPVAAHSSVITDSEQRVIGGFKAIRDITPLAEAEQKIRMILEITQEGILMVDENDRVIYANSRMAEILAQPKDALIGKNAGRLLPFQILNVMYDLVQKVDSEHPQQLRFCSMIQPAETSLREPHAFETCIVLSRVGNSVITCIYFHDLTKHIEIERQLYSANSFLNNIIMSSADGIAVADTEGKILIFNEAAERILGYRAEEIIGNPDAIARIYKPEQQREIMRRLRSWREGPPGKLTSTRMTLISKDGEEIPVNFSAAIIKKNEREIGSVGIFSDLRERLKIRKELDEARAQLMQAEKITSLGRLAAGVAHEINNPLSGILIYADLLQKELAENPQWNEDLQQIIEQTLRCKEIVARLLDFSRQSAVQMVPLEINTVIERSVELLVHQALFRDIGMIVDLQPDIPPMRGNPGQLQQVFTNLILNAGTAMNGKGAINITSRFDPLSEQVVLQFRDTGPGIAPEVADKIFEPFFTTRGPGEGTGLGLSVAYGIIQQHGGIIDGKNGPSGGAIFTILLPLECPESVVEFMV